MRPLRFLLALAALLATGCGGVSETQDPSQRMEVVEVALDFLEDPDAAEVLRAHPEFAPGVDVITPARHYSRDGADMPALEMPPPCELAFSVPSEERPAFLRARAGVDVSILSFLSDDRPAASFRFEVVVDDEPVFRETISLTKGDTPPGSDWVDVGGAGGIEVRPGQRIVLRTALVVDGQEIEPPVRMPVGFGRLRLERSRPVLRKPSSPAAPNVVLVVMDTLRLDRLSAYGYERPTSPHLEALAARGALFENAYATSSWTWPSTASILTGLHPQEHGVLNANACYLGQDLLTVAEALQGAGVTTGGWTGNPLLTVARNFDQGFETFRDSREDFRKTGEFFDEVSSWMEQQAGRRFFLYLQLTEPHHPFVPLTEGKELLAPDVPARFGDRMNAIKSALRTGDGVAPDGTLALDPIASPEERRQASDLYDACVWSGDHWLGELVALLERLELDDETVVVLTSDHGEELFERGFLNHGQSLFPELVRAPLVMAGPGIPAGRRFRQPISNRSLAPFLASLAGVDFQGRFDPGRLFGEGAQESVLFSTEKGFWDGEREQSLYGLRRGGLSLQVNPEAEGARLFEVAADPGEQRDLASERPADVERLRAELMQILQSLDLRETAERRVGAETLRLLEDIGYLGEDE